MHDLILKFTILAKSKAHIFDESEASQEAFDELSLKFNSVVSKEEIKLLSNEIDSHFKNKSEDEIFRELSDYIYKETRSVVEQIKNASTQV